MSPSPIPKVLSTMRGHGVQALRMGGQACVLFGAAEFSRDAGSPFQLRHLEHGVARRAPLKPGLEATRHGRFLPH